MNHKSSFKTIAKSVDSNIECEDNLIAALHLIFCFNDRDCRMFGEEDICILDSLYRITTNFSNRCYLSDLISKIKQYGMLNVTIVLSDSCTFPLPGDESCCGHEEQTT